MKFSKQIPDYNTWNYKAGFYLPPEPTSMEFDNWDTSSSNIIAYYNDPGADNGFLIGLYKGDIDTEQDMFYYNSEGMSGKFVLNKDGTVKKLDDNEIDILINYDVTYSGIDSIRRIRSFILTNTNGIRSYFDNIETDYNSAVSEGSFTTSGSRSSFYISKAVDLNSIDTVYFDYTQREINYIGGWSESIQYFMRISDITTEDYTPVHDLGADLYHPPYQSYAGISYNWSSIGAYNISKIRLPDGSSLNFYYDDKRIDLQGDSSLTRIEIADYMGNLKKYKIKYSYFNSENTVANPAVQAWVIPTTPAVLGDYIYSLDHFYKRLRLDSIYEISGNNTDSLLMYAFEYNDTVLPPRNSKAIDYWGYYCGPARTAYTLIPQIAPVLHETISNEGIQSGNLYPSMYWSINAITYGADRTPDSLYARASVLKKIHLPTGGYSEFKFHTNAVKDPIYYDSWYKLSTVTSPNLPDSAPRNLVFTSREKQEVIFYVNFERVNADGSLYVTPPDTGPPYACLAEAVSSSQISMIIRSTDGTVLKECSFAAVGSGQGTAFVYYILPLNKDYTVTYYYNDNHDPCLADVHFTMKTTAKYVSANTNNLVGGLRTSSIIHYDPVANTRIISVYDYNNDQGLSSGVLPAIPNYESHPSATGKTVVIGMSSIFLYDLYLSRTSSSTQTLGYAFGSNVGYSNVSIRKIDATNSNLGKTSFVYMEPVVKNNFTTYPYSTTQLLDYISGRLLSENIFDKEGNLQKKTENTYITDTGRYDDAKNRSIRIASIRKVEGLAGSGDFMSQRFVANAFYPSHGKSMLGSTREALFSMADSIVTSTEYMYVGDTKTIREISVFNSKGEKQIKKYFYPSDYSNAALSKLVENYVRDIPVASRNYLLKNATYYETGGQGADYAISGNYSRPQTFSVRQALPAIVNTHYTIANSLNVKQPTDAIEGEILSYDSYGNTATFKGKDGILNTVIWGYNGTMPVARITGDSYDNAIAKLTSMTFNEFQLISDPAILRAKLNEIRQSYASNNNVQVTSYTYLPLVGVTSETDAINHTIYYEYDGFGRLILVRNKDGNILKKICYNYAGQVDNCGGSVVAPSCNTSSCSGENKKCINTVCETGTKVCTSSLRTSSTTWFVTYHYVWSDSSISQDYQLSQNGPCWELE